MANIYIFRGKAATGKTTITNALSERINAIILRKDDIFDSIYQHINDNTINNNITYDILARLVNTNLKNNIDIILDIGLYSNINLNLFLSKIDFAFHNKYIFLCECNDIYFLRERWQERFKNPKPNQFFKNFDEVINYYSKLDCSSIENEIIIDSTIDLDIILENIVDIIKKER